MCAKLTPLLWCRFEGDLSDSSDAGSALMTSGGNAASFDVGSPSVSGFSSRSSTRWRLYVLSDFGSEAFGIAELSWFSERKKVDLPSSLTSYVASDGSDLAMAMDGDKNTVALLRSESTGDTGKWIELSFRATVDASKVTLRTALRSENCVSTIAVQYFDTSSQTWTTVSYLHDLHHPRTAVVSYGMSMHGDDFATLWSIASLSFLSRPRLSLSTSRLHSSR